MLTVILLFLILEGVMYLIDIPFKRKIKNSTSVETSLKARKTIKIVRVVSTIVLVILSCIVIVVLSVAGDTVDTIGRDLGLIIAYAITKGWSMLKGNVQANSKEGYLSRHDSYVLYLRAFEADFYDKSPKSYSFESCLAKTVKKRGANICAIGMTKELDAPYGADRVYVSDETWQADVSELMEKSRMIFILMSDRQSCIWEIGQSARMLSKICFIIDDLDKYKNIKNDSTHKIHFPEVDTLLSKLDNTQLDLSSGLEIYYIGFMMNGEELEVFAFDKNATPNVINNELDKIEQIGRLL